MNKVTDIKTITLNGHKRNIFPVWERSGSAWIVVILRSAPRKTANKDLLNSIQR